VYFNVNFNVFFKLIKVYLLVSELYIEREVFYLIYNVRFNNFYLNNVYVTDDVFNIL